MGFFLIVYGYGLFLRKVGNFGIVDGGGGIVFKKKVLLIMV